MTTPEQRLVDLGIELPAALAPIANFDTIAIVGDMAYLSGHGPQQPDGSFSYIGQLGAGITVADGRAAARLTMLNALATVRAALGSLDHVQRVVKLLGLVNSTADFVDHPAVLNGASDLLIDIFGDAGRHARSAIGVSSLPMGIAVEIEMIVQVRGSSPLGAGEPRR